MSNATLPIDTPLRPEHSLLTDEIGNEVYASHYAERKLSRFIIGTESVLLLGAFGTDRLSGKSTLDQSLYSD